MRNRLLYVFACLILLAAAVPPTTAHANTLTVSNLNDSGTGSLRAALSAATDGDTISFQSGLSGTIHVATTLNVTADITINGPGASVIALDGGGAVSIMYIGGLYPTVHVSGLTFQNGHDQHNGAGIFSYYSTLYVDSCVFSSNHTDYAEGGGGAIFNNTGTLYVNNSTFSNNNIQWGIGGAIQNKGENTTPAVATITNSVFAGNSTGESGGAIGNFLDAQLTVINSTFYNNTASSGGAIGTIWSGPDFVTILDSTFNNNTSNGGVVGNYVGGAIDVEESQTSVTIGNDIIYGNHATYYQSRPDINGPVTSLGYNMIGSGTGVTGLVSTDQTGVDPLLGSLGNNGGPTYTMALQPASPAIATGNCTLGTPVTTDQRGEARKSPSCDVGAYEAPYYPVVYNTKDHGGGSLRYVVNYATAGTTIAFDPATFNGQQKTITLTNGGLTLPASLTILGPGPDHLTVDGNNASTVFIIPVGVNASISGLTIADGSGGTNGGGIDNAGTLALSNCVFVSNKANTGGGLKAHGGTVSITGCTFSANQALTGYGGGAYTSGQLTVINSTFSANSAYVGGGGIYVNSLGMLTVANSTIAKNTAGAHGGGIYDYQGTTNFTLGSTIVAGNTAGVDGPDINGVVVSLGNNLVQDSTASSGLVTSDQKFKDPLLGSLNYNGGLTKTMPLDPSSPAIGMGNCALGSPAAPVTTDQRTVTRKTPACDVGSYEAAYDPTVRNTNDSGGSSLRYVLTDATPGTTVVFDPTVFSTAQTIQLKGSPLEIATNLTIQGPGANLLTIDGRALSRVLSVDYAVTAAISGLTVENGYGTNGAGLSNAGMLALSNCVITNNHATSYGGGIYAVAGSLTIKNCTISNNNALDGGGLYNHAGSSVMITNSTFYGNSAQFGGGLMDAASATLTLSFSTVAANAAIGLNSGGGGMYLANATVNLGNTIVAGNTGRLISMASDIDGTVVSQGYNLVGNTGGATGLVGSDIQNVDPKLASSLADNGGPTPTLALLVGSPAINAANDAVCPGTDQRGATRKQGAHCDIGAYEALTISGNAGVAGAVISYTGGPVIADVNGNYLIIVPLGWSGTITPSKTSYVFTPLNRNFTNVLVSYSGQNFTAKVMTYFPFLRKP